MPEMKFTSTAQNFEDLYDMAVEYFQECDEDGADSEISVSLRAHLESEIARVSARFQRPDWTVAHVLADARNAHREFKILVPGEDEEEVHVDINQSRIVRASWMHMLRRRPIVPERMMQTLKGDAETRAAFAAMVHGLYVDGYRAGHQDGFKVGDADGRAKVSKAWKTLVDLIGEP